MSKKSEPKGIIVPDEAVYYVVSRYLEGKNKEGFEPVVIGISTGTVESILQLFVDWAGRNGHVKDGVLTIGSPTE